ncbi:hypothetical protein Tdes44962_MAKER09765 [Teratosphaeria destructans]|uniref:Kinetochore protein Sos7 coiled-coil domain-containing protein n=1 Tax=Teratosphaeria destructans TaxID=418781 RepID=A0A9W7SRL0_9PEZI|nr:hypothetical protein Tdes44962_MAKER09765 [Teratosphaeria destructans]
MEPQIHLDHLSILHLAQPLLTPTSPTTTNRDSSSSSSSTTITTPSLLAADLTHYKDLFTKLRFSYVEQVTKERFLRAITASPPDFVDARQNAELELKLAEDKKALKVRKEEVAGLIRELEAQGRSLAERYEGCQERAVRVRELPGEIEALEATISRLRASCAPRSENPDLNLSLPATSSLLDARVSELEDLDERIAAVRSSLVERREVGEGLRDEMALLQVKKVKAVQEAQEARRRREQAGGDLDERGRYLRSVEGTMRGLLEV